MIPYALLTEEETKQHQPERLDLSGRILLFGTKLFPKLTISLKLSYYQHFIAFLETIGIYLIVRNKLTEQLRAGMSAGEQDQISFTFFQLLRNYGLVRLENKNYFLTENLSGLTNADFEQLKKLIEGGDEDFSALPPILQDKLQSYQFVNALQTAYRNPDYPLKNVQYADRWKQLITNKQLDYEIRLTETLKQLEKLRLPEKIKSPFDDCYYTESGRNAFKNFTEKRFHACLDFIGKQHPVKSVLDVGCGYGNYIEAVHDWSATTKVTGIEMQQKVIAETQKRFDGNASIELINDNIFNFSSDTKFDLILLNYVLFYFSTADKHRLFAKFSELLSPGGSVLICQYYAGIEPLKKQLLREQEENSASKRTGMYFGNKILYANALWNDASDAFVQAEIWDEFEAVLSEQGFEINNITHADPFYYSLFIEIKKH